MDLASTLAERRLLPDSLIRYGIRKQLATHSQWLEKNPRSTESWIEALNNRPIAESIEKSKEQHYEVPTEYFQLAFGTHLKYSCCLWNEGVRSLTDAEAASLKLTCERAQVKDGQSILELGCGWGSLSLWMAEHYPRSTITAMSHSKTQKAWIEAQAKSRNLGNLTVITSDINDFKTEQRFDRILSLKCLNTCAITRKSLKHSILGSRQTEKFLFMYLSTKKKPIYLKSNTSAIGWRSIFLLEESCPL